MLNPGDVFEEAALVAPFGVSRTPVREALMQIEAAGLVRRLPRKGATALDAATAAGEGHFAAFGESQTDAYYQLNLRFHAAVAEAAGNPFLLDMIKTNARKLMAYYRARYRYAGSIESSAREHRAIAALITARDSEGAERAMQRHVQFDQVTAMDLLAAVG